MQPLRPLLSQEPWLRAALDRLSEAVPPAGGAGTTGGRREPQTPRVPAHRVWAWGALALAACLAAFFAGISISDRGAGRGPTAPAAPARYLLLLYEDESYRAPVTPAEREARVAEYVEWAAELRERGIEIEGEELAPSAEADRLEGRVDGVEVARGAPAGPAGRLAGYFVVEAPDRAAALAIARTTPHLEHGGTVVVRRVMRQ